MYILTSSVIETIKTLCLSILCSIIFSLMIFRETVVIYRYVCFVLNIAAFLLFLYLYRRNWRKVYRNTFSTAEYAIPAAVSFLIYAAFSTLLYINNAASFYGVKVSYIFRWLFQHTRFLEPMLNSEYAFISVLISPIITAGILIHIFLTESRER